jgi:hypothetical protein
MRTEKEIKEALEQVIDEAGLLQKDDPNFGKYLIAIQTLRWILDELKGGNHENHDSASS